MWTEELTPPGCPPLPRSLLHRSSANIHVAVGGASIPPFAPEVRSRGSQFLSIMWIVFPQIVTARETYRQGPGHGRAGREGPGKRNGATGQGIPSVAHGRRVQSAGQHSEVQDHL